MAEISPFATVEKTAKLAEDVSVGAFSYIGGEVEIASGCVIDNSVTITGRTIIGQDNRFFPMAVIGTSTEETDQPGRCVLGKANTIREHVTIYAGDKDQTQIGNDNLIMIGCTIGPGAQIADHGIFDNYTLIGPNARVGDYVRMSGYAAICPGTAVGEYAFVTGYTNVDSDAPPFARVQGFPMRVRGANTTNLKRCGFGDDDIRAIKTAFRELFNGSAYSVDAEVLEKLLTDSNSHVRRLAGAVQHYQARGPAQ